MPVARVTRETIMERVRVDPDTGCWSWIAPGNRCRCLDNNTMRASRCVWLLLRGPIPDGLRVTVRCENNRCVNPDHLFLGKRADKYCGPTIVPTEVRFWRWVNKTEGCWLWTGATAGEMGYGQINTPGNRRVQTHRYSYELHKGPIPPGLQVLHTCDVPRCVNPDHLRVGTQEDNMRDMVAKGRQWKQSRRQHAFADDLPHSEGK